MGDEAAKEKRAPATPVAVGAQFSNVDASGDPAALVRYLDDTAQRLRELKRASYALLDLKPGDAVLDVGCGPASDVLELERVVGPTGRTVGVDVSEAMVEEARRRATAAGSRAQFEVAPAESLPFPDATFDAVRTERVLMHVADPARAVDEIARVTNRAAGLSPSSRTTRCPRSMRRMASSATGASAASTRRCPAPVSAGSCRASSFVPASSTWTLGLHRSCSHLGRTSRPSPTSRLVLLGFT